MTEERADDIEPLTVAEAKARFSELADRVGRGERFVVTRRGVPTLGLVPPSEIDRRPTTKVGLAALAGALADWDEIDDVIAEIYRARQRSADRPAPELG